MKVYRPIKPRPKMWLMPIDQEPDIPKWIGYGFLGITIIVFFTVALTVRYQRGRANQLEIQKIQGQINALQSDNAKLWDQINQLQKKATTATSAPVTHGIASWLIYAQPDSCAALQWPKGSRLKVQAGTRSIICIRRDSGPYVPGRVIDLSLEQFSQLADPKTGLVNVTVQPI